MAGHTLERSRQDLRLIEVLLLCRRTSRKSRDSTDTWLFLIYERRLCKGSNHRIWWVDRGFRWIKHGKTSSTIVRCSNEWTHSPRDRITWREGSCELWVVRVVPVFVFTTLDDSSRPSQKKTWFFLYQNTGSFVSTQLLLSHAVDYLFKTTQRASHSPSMDIKYPSYH